MSTHNIGFYEDLTKIIFELSSNIIKYAPYFFCCYLTNGFIMLTLPCYYNALEPHFNTVKLGFTGVYIIFHLKIFIFIIIRQNIANVCSQNVLTFPPAA